MYLKKFSRLIEIYQFFFFFSKISSFHISLFNFV